MVHNWHRKQFPQCNAFEQSNGSATSLTQQSIQALQVGPSWPDRWICSDFLGFLVIHLAARLEVCGKEGEQAKCGCRGDRRP